jgi:hypothetical protein
VKLKLEGRRFDTIEEIHAESQRVLDTLTEKDLQEAFQKLRRRWDRCLHAEGDYFEADRPYGEFCDVYSVSPQYFGYTLLIICILNVNLFVYYTKQQQIHDRSVKITICVVIGTNFL